MTLKKRERCIKSAREYLDMEISIAVGTYPLSDDIAFYARHSWN